VDAHGRRAFRMALATREQHIRREKATSNICTAQALLANMAAMYAVYHGPEGLKAIAGRVHALTRLLDGELKNIGLEQTNAHYFDTLRVVLPNGVDELKRQAGAARINFRIIDETTVGIALNETVDTNDLRDIVNVFARTTGKPETRIDVDAAARSAAASEGYPPALRRTSEFLAHPVFNTHRSETQMMRYIRSLERKDIGLDTSMIPLGSCTMKLNATAEMEAISWPEFASIHPFAPDSQTEGWRELIADLEAQLTEITGYDQVSIQPKAGSPGELAGLLAIRGYHLSRGDAQRNVCLIPASAHGTNAASAVLAGMKVVVVATAADGTIDHADLNAKIELHKDALSAIMITYPSTHGVYDADVREVCDAIHAAGGQVYVDGGTDLGDLRLEHAVGRRVRDHQGRQGVAVRVDLGPQVRHVDVAVLGRGHDDDPQAGHDRRGGVGAVGG